MSAPTRPNRPKAYFFLLLNTAIWGLAIPIVKLGYDHGLTPKSFLIDRYLIASLFSLPLILYFYSKHRKTFFSFPYHRIIPIELLGTTFGLLLLYTGVRYTPAVEASLLSITWPIYATLGGVLFLKEKEEKHEITGFLIALIGSIVLVISPLFESGFSGSLYGNGLIFLFTLVNAAYYLLAKKHYQHLNKWLVVSISSIVTFIGLSFIEIIKLDSPFAQIILPFQQPSPWPLIAVFYMGILGSILALTFYLLGQNEIEASEASLFNYLQPIFAIPASIILLSDYPKPLDFFALGLILLGVFLAEKRK